jgi:hypothetical protein
LTTYNIPIPDTDSWERWAGTLIQLNPPLQNYLSVTQDFKSFGQRLSQIEARTPRPEFFRSWQAWAASLRRALST